MPIRFQVDPDFYDHPKTLDASDAAVALWTRAGSYSTAKLLDGFVPDGALALLSKTPADASAELVRRGLWKRVRGGFQFHEWDHRNLTKARVEADRDYDRTRKQRERQSSRRNGHQQVTPTDVRTGHPPGLRTDSTPDSEGSPDRSVSVSLSVSESVSGSGHGTVSYPQAAPGHPGPEPPRKCPDHKRTASTSPCGACFEQRRAHGEWEAARNEWYRVAPKCRAHPGQLLRSCSGCAADRKARGGDP